MKKNLTVRESVAVMSMLFGMFFGAGNLIFPAALGTVAGNRFPLAYAGMFITAVGLPLLAIVALAISRSEGVVDLADRVGHGYSVFFCTLLYLTIGPLFAIPRCASTSFTVGAVNLLGGVNEKIAAAVFSFVFFAIVLVFSLRPSGIMTWIGKILNPVFLVCLAVLVVAALIHPIDAIATLTPGDAYASASGAFFSGFLEGYGTLDALAGLAFGIVVVSVVRRHNVLDGDRIAANTARSGIFSCLAMGVIYFFITLVAAQSTSICAGLSNGGEILGVIAEHYFHSFGAVLMTAIVTFACMKTAIGLVTSCSEAFIRLFPKGPTYPVWAILISLVSFGIANLGLTSIVAYCVPVLMFLYPLAITLILLGIFGKFFDHDRAVYISTTVFTFAAAAIDFLRTLASTLRDGGVTDTALFDRVVSFGDRFLPLSSLGLGWICPAAVGCILGVVIHLAKRPKRTVA